MTITKSTKEEGARPDRTSPLSRTRRTGCCIPEVILSVGVHVEGTGKGEEEKEPSGKRRRERVKKRFLNSRSGRPGASIPERFVCIAGLGGI